MPFAKGLSICEDERRLVLQGFTEQLNILEAAEQNQENSLKAQLYDIITDFSLTDEEKSDLKRPYQSFLQELEERHIRIRRSVFMGIYAFWELSLMEIVRTHFSKELLSKNSTRMGAYDYLTVIYGADLPAPVEIINTHIREFRNYLVHGSLNEDRATSINYLIKSHPTIGIKGSNVGYYLSDYKGLRTLLDLFSQELDNAEKQLITTKKHHME
ncbi:MAG: hypothetical protein NC210_08765 [[Clostridium] fimetarium]|nr:hypothetical protein [Alistipes timonensis]MCM1406499.1 hypothetical protein [[Clostridium] fimetarium]